MSCSARQRSNCCNWCRSCEPNAGISSGTWFARTGTACPAMNRCWRFAAGGKLRKGQARSLELAARSAANCRFKFIGADRPPGRAPDDPAISRHRFLGPMSPDDAKLEIARSGALCELRRSRGPAAIRDRGIDGQEGPYSCPTSTRTGMLAALMPECFPVRPDIAAKLRRRYSKVRSAIADEEVARRASETAQALFGQAAFDRRLRDVLRVLRKESGPGAEVERYQDA